jgi:eukaryotic-like serine/threonine-protein kinase
VLETPESLGGRFRVERVVGRGGAGVVYRAFDEDSGQPVALKVVAAAAGVAPEEEERLTREGRVLQTLDHPGIVRVVASGRLDDTGQPFVAMEWLEGEDLHARHQRAPLTYSQSLELAMLVANALGAAHDAGVIHRDVKPSNIFLSAPGTAAPLHLDATPKLVDFGVAMVEDIRVTKGGEVVGTPAYMAPEQARGDAPVDLRCDVYALGATLFELLTNRPPHVGPTAIATLARLVTTTPPRLRELRRDVPALLDQLVHRMLSSDAMNRPGSAQEVADSLRLLLKQSDSSHLILDGLDQPLVSSRLGSSASRLVTSIMAIGFSSTSARETALGRLRDGGADAIPLGSDAIVAHLGATRAVGREATVALDLGRTLAASGARVGVASGRARVDLLVSDGSVQPVGEVVDRASALAREARPGSVLADATTTELGRGRYEFRARDDGAAVVGEELHGRGRGEHSGGTPFVGREPELAQVVASFDRAISDSTPIIVSVTGPPGIGKTRLRREVLARVAAQHDSPRVFLQRSDAYGMRHALGAAADALRALLGLAKGASVEDAERSIIEELGPETRHEVTRENREILARLLADKALPKGVDPRGARDLLWLAMTDLVLNAIGREPTVIVLEDLQWADPESIGWLDHLVGRATGRPLIVLALVRSDFWAAQAGRFAGRDHVRIELRPISKKASRAIARSYLRDNVSEEVLDRIADQAAGSPLFAEELSRLAAAGGNTELAPTIQAAIQASLDALDDECRDAVGRLSVFGMTCWDEGLAALGMPDVDQRMRQLAASEVLVEQHQSRFTGSREWLFKHAMVREVIYDSLGELEARELHALAADWLAQMGEDASIVAGHYELGGQDAKAAQFLARAAERALTTNALADALSMAERALAFAETPEEGFARARILDDAWSRLDPRASDRETAVSALEENVHDQASAVLARGARARYDAARGSGTEISERLAEARDAAAALGEHEEEARCSAALASRLAFAGDFLSAEREARRLLQLAEDHTVRSAAVDAWQTLAIVHQTQGKPSAALEARRSAAAAARSAGLREREAMLTCNLGFALTTLGARQEARAALERGLELADAIGSSGAVRHALMNLLGWAATFGTDKKLEGLLAEPREAADSSATGVWAAPDRANLGMLFYRGSELLRSDTPSALGRARTLLQMSTEGYRATQNRDVLPVALGMWALAERRTGNLERALELATEAAELLDRGAPSLLNEAVVYLVLHDCYVALGRTEDARTAAGHGIPHLLRRVKGLVGTPYVRSFLTELSHNASLIACAEEYGLVPDAIHRVLEGTS